MPVPGHLGLEMAPSPRGARRSRPLRDRPAIRIIAVLLAWLGWSLGHALTNPAAAP